MENRKNRIIRTGFTLVEVMAVLIIIGLLATVVATRVVGNIDKARVTKTKADLRSLHHLVNQFYMDTGRYPTEDEGLNVLIEPPSDVSNYPPGGYIETDEISKDAWGREYIYEIWGTNDFVIKSLGADGQEGGEGINTDLLSTDAQ